MLEIVDESDQHRGHAGWVPNSVTHLRIRIVSPLFEGKTRLACHRLVQEALKEEWATGLHALAIEAKAPSSP